MNSNTSSNGNPRSLLPKTEPGSSSVSPIPDTPSAPEPAPKRRCISSACMPCRKRKSKCDGIHPSCHACISVYGSTCYYDIDSDHRRKGALKRDISLLKDDLRPRNTILDALRTGSEADVDDIIQLLRGNQHDDYHTLAAEVQRMIGNGKNRPSERLEGELKEFSSKETTALYGHTSNLHAGCMEDLEEHMPNVGISNLGTEMWTTVSRDTEFISHLLDLYFTWSHPFYVLFPEEAFRYGLEQNKSKYCTPLLVNAILANGCHSSDRIEARAVPSDPLTVGDHFGNEAQRLLKIDSRPCLTTVQALALMSIHEAMNCRDSLGWLLICQAIGMAIELGLNREHLQPKSKMTSTEIQARRISFWGLYLLQTGWAICVGRISLLPRTAIRVERPMIKPDLENKLWVPHGQSDYQPGHPSQLTQPGLVYTILSEAGKLCEVVDDIVQMFYAPRDRITSRRLQRQHERLQDWYTDLPHCLAIKQHGPTLQQLLCLHMFYWNCIVHLFRPFLQLLYVQTTSSTRLPREICTDAADKISELLRLMDQYYDLKRVSFMTTHCAVTAGIIHIYNIANASNEKAPPGPPVEQSQIYLCEAIRGLKEMKSTYPLVERYLRLLQSLTFDWCKEHKVPVPSVVSEAFSEAEIVSPASTSSVSASSRQTPSAAPRPSVARRTSAPDLIPMLDHNPSMPTPPPNLYWTPFPNTQDGILLQPVDNGTGQHMDINTMLDSGVHGDWPQLNRDGFTTSGELWQNWY